MFDPFQSSTLYTIPNTINRDSQHDNETYYSSASDSDNSGAERRSVKSSSSSRVGKYTPPHRKSGSASPTKDLSVRPPPADSESPVDPAVAADLAAPVVSSSDGFPIGQSSASPSSASSSSTPAPSSPATSATSSTVTSKQSDKQCYVYIRTGHCAKGTLCPYKHDSLVPVTNTVKHFDPKSHPSYRTKPCYPFIYGQCLKGDSCTFKHEVPSPQVLAAMSPTSPEVPTPPPVLGAPEYRTKECKWFSSPGGCWYGDTCKFKHTITPGTNSPAKPSQQPVSGGVPLSTTGPSTPTTSRRSEEHLPGSGHPSLRTLPCPAYMQGACNKGDLCTYLHIDLPIHSASASLAASPRTPLMASSPNSPFAAADISSFLASGAFALPRHPQPRHSHSIPTPGAGGPLRQPHHAFSLPLYSTTTTPTKMMSPSPFTPSANNNNPLDIPTTPTMTASTTSSSSAASSSSASASPTSSLMASSPPQSSFFHRYNEIPDHLADEEVDVPVIGGNGAAGMRFGAIGTGIPSLSKEPLGLQHEIYLYDDDEEDEVVYMPSNISPSPPSF